MIAPVELTHRDRLPRSSRYELLAKIASGGMATVYVGRLRGAAGFSRLVAIKRTHAHLLEDAAMKRMLLAETDLASRIHHANVVAIQDVEEIDGELLLVMDYVEGDALSTLLRGPARMPARLAVRIVLDACAGLHAAHTLGDDRGRPLHLVHRDVSPQNILVGLDGVARLADFGIAKPTAEVSSGGTTTGALKGKPAYMAPEYVGGAPASATSDVFGLGVVAWEALTGRRLFRGESEIETLRLVLACAVAPPSEVAPSLDPALDAVVLKAVARLPGDRFPTALAFAEALEEAARAAGCVAPHAEVGRFAGEVVGAKLETRRAQVRELLEARTPEEARPEPRPAQASLETVSLAPAAAAPATATAIASPAARERQRRSRAAPLAAVVVLGAAGITLSVWRRGGAPEPTPAATAPASAETTSAAPPPATTPSADPPAPALPSVSASAAAPRSRGPHRAPLPAKAAPPAARPEPQEKAPPNPYAH